MSRETKFWDRMAERYSRSPVSDEVSYQEKLRVTREYFRPEMNVLEFGCGTGSTALTHAPYVKHIQATDISTKMIEIAQRKADAENIENVSFEKVSLDALALQDGSMDAVMGMSILHLLADKEAAIAKVLKMLKPGGVFVSSTVCLGDTMKFFKIIGPIGYRLGLIPLVKVLTEQELVTSITDAGFEIDHHWRPGKGKAVFIVAKKPA